MRANDKIDYNLATYEKEHVCPECFGVLRLTGKSSESQSFVCCNCKKRFRLNLFDNTLAVTGEVGKSNGVVRSPYNLKCTVYTAQ